MQLAAAALRQLAEVQATLAVVQGASVAPTQLRSPPCRRETGASLRRCAQGSVPCRT
jgi:hypothetical protein